MKNYYKNFNTVLKYGGNNIYFISVKNNENDKQRKKEANYEKNNNGRFLSAAFGFK